MKKKQPRRSPSHPHSTAEAAMRAEMAHLHEMAQLQRIHLFNRQTELQIVQLWVESEPGRRVLPVAVAYRDYLRSRLVAHNN